MHSRTSARSRSPPTAGISTPPARDTDAVVVFDRDPTTGALNQKAAVAGCLTADSAVASAEGWGLVGIGDAPAAAAVSPDGNNVYLVGNAGNLVNLIRAADGSLSA